MAVSVRVDCAGSRLEVDPYASLRRVADRYEVDRRAGDYYAAGQNAADLADLYVADLCVADLCVADLIAADLIAADLIAADLTAADLFAAVSLTWVSDAQSLERPRHASDRSVAGVDPGCAHASVA